MGANVLGFNNENVHDFGIDRCQARWLATCLPTWDGPSMTKTCARLPMRLLLLSLAMNRISTPKYRANKPEATTSTMAANQQTSNPDDEVYDIFPLGDDGQAPPAPPPRYRHRRTRTPNRQVHHLPRSTPRRRERVELGPWEAATCCPRRPPSPHAGPRRPARPVHPGPLAAAILRSIAVDCERRRLLPLLPNRRQRPYSFQPRLV